MTRKAVYAGSFNPPTLGHLYMIEEAAKMFDEVVVAIGVNPLKKPLFTVEERLEMLCEITNHLPTVRIDAFTNKYLVDYARSIDCCFMVRGIRNSGDFEFERAMNNMNTDLAPTISTVFLMPPRNIAEVSSSMIKALMGPEGWEEVVARYVPPSVLQKLVNRFNVS